MTAGFHRNQGGTAATIDPVAHYAAALDAAHLRPFVVVIGEGGHAAELLAMGAIVAFAKDDWRFAPAYDSGDAAGDAAARWALIKSQWPPELSKDAWCIVLNEPDKEQAPYVFAFMLAVARLANADGYRVCGPNWSTGTPEVEEWETPEGLAWLRYCAANPERAAIGLHEYSLDAADIETGAPWLCGRYQFVLDVCDDHGIAHPPFLICECGWTYNDMPEPDQALTQLAWMAEVYGNVPFALWTLGGWEQGPNLPPKLARFVPGMTDWIIANSEPEEEEEPMETLEKLLWETGLQRQVLSIYSRAALGNRIYADGLVPMSPEYDVEYDGMTYRAQRAGALTTNERRVYFCEVPRWGTVWHIDGPEPLYSAPVGTVEERAGGEIWPGDWVDANVYGNRYRLGDGWSRHTGADLNLNAPHWNADRGMPVHAICHGTVTYARRVPTGTWGRLVVVRHETPDGVRHSRYGHMASLLVEEGQEVRRGDVLGTIGGAEFGLSDHLHFDISHSGILQSDPTHWPGDNLPVVHAHYLPPKTFLESQGKVDAPAVPAQPAIDLLPYICGDGRLYEVRNAQGGQERFQSQAIGNIFYQTKNSQWEMLGFDEDHIYRYIDTSPGGGRFYELSENGQPGSHWIPRFWRPGESYTRSRRVQFYRKNDCAPLPENSGNVTDTMRFVKRFASYTFRTGIVLQDVIKLEWVNGGELYYYARGYGLCAWERLHQDPNTPQWSAISEIHAPGARPSNEREKIDCL